MTKDNVIFFPGQVVEDLSYRSKEVIEMYKENKNNIFDFLPEIGKTAPDLFILDRWRHYFESINVPFAVTLNANGSYAMWKQKHVEWDWVRKRQVV